MLPHACYNSHQLRLDRIILTPLVYGQAFFGLVDYRSILNLFSQKFSKCWFLKHSWRSPSLGVISLCNPNLDLMDLILKSPHSMLIPSKHYFWGRKGQLGAGLQICVEFSFITTTTNLLIVPGEHPADVEALRNGEVAIF